MRSLQRSPFSSKKFAQDRLKLASRRFFVLPSSYTRLSSYMSSNFFMWDEASHMESGSRPAGSFSTATMKMPFSRYVVYHVSTPIISCRGRLDRLSSRHGLIWSSPLRNTPP